MEESKVKVLNVGLLGLAFMLVFTAFQTMGNVQTTILDSARNSNSTGYVEGFTGSGYTSLAVIYAVFAFSNWFAPSVISIVGARISLVIGGVAYALFIAQLMYPNNYLLYSASVLIGMGAAIIWTAQGNFLTINSDDDTMSRNSGVFWAMLQCSLLIGNTYVFFEFQDMKEIDSKTRFTVAIVLLAICVVGVLTFFLLRPTPWANQRDATSSGGPVQALKGALRLGLNKYILLLSVTFFYTGLALTFWSGVYGSSIGFTNDFGSEAKSLVGLHGIVVGVGEISGGLLFGIFGHLLVKRGRDPVVISGFVVHMVAFFLAFINLPNDAPFSATKNHAFIDSNRHLAILGSFLLGFGDACYNTQIYSMLGSVFSQDSASAFAIFKFTQSLSAAIAFFYSTELMLYYQLLILVIFCVAGTITFCLVEWMTHRDALLAISKVETDATPGQDLQDNSCAIPQDATDDSNILVQRSAHITVDS